MAHIFFSIFLLLSGLSSTVQQSQEPIDFNEHLLGDAIVIDSPALKSLAISSTLAAAVKISAKITYYKKHRTNFRAQNSRTFHRSNEYMTPYMFQSNYLRI
ncbi:hypothetical protein AF332_17285 [Sporosarcina globispora]|uniref:Uncharacterized protein n=1 Tax=Sporosarcina globispora TaxID=1459 RepID=A0A0M0GG26_SPOGL|nr:hypothetical protein AF332_17285 [Sporosarcina globispora]